MIFKIIEILTNIGFIIKNKTDEFFIICFSVLILYIFYLFLTKKSYNYDYYYNYYNFKITSFVSTIFLASLYPLGYIGIFLILRFLSLNQIRDLKPTILKINIFLFHSPGIFIVFLKIIFIIFLIMLWIVLMVKLRHSCLNNLIKLHLYAEKKYLFYRKMVLHVRDSLFHISFSGFVIRFVVDINIFLCNLAQNVKFIRKLFPATTFWISRKYSRIIEDIISPTLSENPLLFFKLFLFCLFIIIFVYECIQNNFVLYLTLWYSFFYLIIIVVLRILLFLSAQNNTLNEILYEMYYCEEKVKYINLLENDHKRLFFYTRGYLSEHYLVSYKLSDLETSESWFDCESLLEKRYIYSYEPIYSTKASGFVYLRYSMRQPEDYSFTRFVDVIGCEAEDVETIHGHYYTITDDENEPLVKEIKYFLKAQSKNTSYNSSL